jgi:hypothetical protein
MKEHASRNPALQAKKKGGFFNKKGPGTFFGPSASPTPFFPGQSNETAGPEPAGASGAEPAVQTKLTVGEPNDVYEKEADATADKVVQRLSAGDDKRPAPPAVQKKCADCEAKDEKKEPPLQTKPIFDSKADPLEDGVRRKESSSATPAVTPSVESGLRSSKGGGSPLPASTRKQMESGMGADFSGVRIHNDGNARQMSKDLNAQAFTHGKDIYFNSGKYDPSGAGGKHLLAHELTHVVQQGGGSIKRKPASPVPTATPLPATAAVPSPAPAASQATGLAASPSEPQKTERQNEEKLPPEETDDKRGTPDLTFIHRTPNIQKAGGGTGGNNSGGGSNDIKNMDAAAIQALGTTKEGKIDKKNGKIEIHFNDLPSKQYVSKFTEPDPADPQKEILAEPPYLKPNTERKTKQGYVWRQSATPLVVDNLNALIAKKTVKGPSYRLFVKASPTIAVTGSVDEISRQVAVPFWGMDGLPIKFQIEHKVDWQIAGGNKNVDVISNLILLDSAANLQIGQDVLKNMKLFYDKIIAFYKSKQITGLIEPFDEGKGAYDIYTDSLVSQAQSVPGTLISISNMDVSKTQNPFSPDRVDIMDENLQPGELVLRTAKSGAGNIVKYTFSNDVAEFKTETVGGELQLKSITLKGFGKDEKGNFDQSNPDKNLNVIRESKDHYRVETQGYATILKDSIRGVKKLSPIEWSDVDFNILTGWQATGKVNTDVPFLKAVNINITLENSILTMEGTVDTTALTNILPTPFQVDYSSLTLSASSNASFAIGGAIGFSMGKFGKGTLTGKAGTDGFGVGGSFEFDKSYFTGKLTVDYTKPAGGNENWSVKGSIALKKGAIKSVDSLTIDFSYADKTLSGSGDARLSLPGIKQIGIKASVGDNQLTIGGDFQLSDIPKLKGATGRITLTKTADGWDLGLTGKVQPDIDIKGLTVPEVDISYQKGVFDISATAHFEKGKFKGDFTVGVTNSAVSEDGKKTGGDGGKKMNFYADGHITVDIVEGVGGDINVKMKPEGDILLDGKVMLTDDKPLFQMPDLHQNVFTLDQNIPLASCIVLTLSLHFGGSLDIYARLKPLTFDKGSYIGLSNVSLKDFSHATITSRLSVSSHLEAGVILGLELGLDAKLLGILDAKVVGTGSLDFRALDAAVNVTFGAGWSADQGIKLNDGSMKVALSSKLIASLGATISVYADLLVTTINLWSHHWDLATKEWKIGLFGAGDLVIPLPIGNDGKIALTQDDMRGRLKEKVEGAATQDNIGKRSEKLMDGEGTTDEDRQAEASEVVKKEIVDRFTDPERFVFNKSVDYLHTRYDLVNYLRGKTQYEKNIDLSYVDDLIKKCEFEEYEKFGPYLEKETFDADTKYGLIDDFMTNHPTLGDTERANLRSLVVKDDKKQPDVKKKSLDTPPPVLRKPENGPPAQPGKEPAKPDFNLHMVMDVPKDDPKPDYSRSSNDIGAWENADFHFDLKRFVICDSIQEGDVESSFVTDIGWQLNNPRFLFQIANEIYRGMNGSLNVDEVPGVQDPTSKEVMIIFHQINIRILRHSKEHFARYRQAVLEEEKQLRNKLLTLPGKSKPKKMAKKQLESFANSMLDFLVSEFKYKLWKITCELEHRDYPKLLVGIHGVSGIFAVTCDADKPKVLPEPILVTAPGKKEPVRKDKPPVQRKPEDEATPPAGQPAPQGQGQGQGQPTPQDQPQPDKQDSQPQQPPKQDPQQPPNQDQQQPPKQDTQQPQSQTPPDQSPQPAGQNQSTPGNATPSPAPAPAASPGNATPPPAKTAPSKQPARSSVLTSINAGTASPALMGILQAIDNEQQKLTANGEQRKLQIMAAAQAQKLAIRDTIHTQATRLEQVFEDAIAAINTAVTDARVGMITEREKKIAEVQLHGNTQIAALGQSTDAHRNAISTAAETTAAAAEKTGETQAQRVLADSSRKAGQAITIGENTIPKYSSYDRSARIGSAIRDISSDLASNYIDVGNELAKAARKDAGDMAGKFRGESVQSMEHFMVAESTGISKIAEQRDQTVTGLTQLTQDPITQLDQTATDLIMQLSNQRVEAVLQVLQSNTGVEAAIDQQSAQATTIIDKQTHEAGDRLTDFGVQLYKSFGQEAPSPKQIAEVSKLVGDATAKFAAALDKFTADVDQSLVAGNAKIAKDIDAQVTATAAPVQQTRQGFGNTVANVAGQVAQAINDTVLKAEQNMDTVVTETEKTYQDSVDKSTAEWNDELVKGSAEIINRMDTGLSKLDETLAKLPSQLSERAEEIEHEGILHRIGSWVAGFVVGLIEEAVDFAIGLAVILLVIVAILVIAALLVAAFLGLDVLIGAILAIGAAIAAAAEVIAAIVEVAAGIAFLVGIYVGIKYIYLSITRPDLSDYERGKLAGRGVFQLGLAVFGEKIFGKLGEWVKSLGPEGRAAKNLARLKELITDEQQLERMMVLFGKDTGRLEKALAAFGDDSARLDKALTAFGNDAGKLEQALKTFGGNGARLEKALGAFSDDSAALGKALTAYGNDAGQLEKALTTFGEDGARLNKALAAFGNDAARMEKALTAFGEDTARMEKALGRFGGNGADLERALDKCGGNGARLEALLDNPKISDTKQLLSLLDDYGATQLEELLKISTVPNGAQLERMAKVFKDVGFGNGLTGALQTDQLGRLASPGILDELEKAAALQGAGKVTGVQDWIKFNAPKGLDELQDTVGELREAERQAAQADPGSTIGVGAENNAPPRPGAPNEKAKSFDLEVKDSTGKVTGSTEFKRLDTPVEKVENLRDSVRHGADKAAERAAEGIPIEGTLETTIQMTLDVGIRPAGPNSIEILADGTRNIIRADTGAIAKTTNIFDDFAKFLSGVENNGYLNVVNLVDDTGKLIASYQRTGAVWVRIF